MAMAIRDSVTVSIADEISGIRSEMCGVNRAVVSASLGNMAECAGSSRTSSKVSAGGLNFSSLISLSRCRVLGCVHPNDTTQWRGVTPGRGLPVTAGACDRAHVPDGRAADADQANQPGPRADRAVSRAAVPFPARVGVCLQNNFL